MFRCCIRRLSQYKNPQQYKEFIGNLKENKPKDFEVPLETYKSSSLTFRKVEVEDYDFLTESSDFDIERFSLKEYL